MLFQFMFATVYESFHIQPVLGVNSSLLNLLLTAFLLAFLTRADQ